MNDNVQKKLNDLHKLYTKNLPKKIAQIVRLWKEQSHHWDLVQFETFHREVHSLCGSAGTYGYPELSKKAREMEIVLKTILNKANISIQDIQQITAFLDQLQLVLALEISSKKMPIEANPSEIIDPQCVYIMEKDIALKQDLIEGLKQIGFNPYPIQDMITLQRAIKEKIPGAIILDTDYLIKKDKQLLLEIQNEQINPIPLFCTLPNETLLPRLEAVRAGCQAFFQKPVEISALLQLINDKCSASPSETYRILIVDDSLSMGQYYSLILTQAGLVARAITNPLDLLMELESFQPHLLLMDVYMPECTGFELAAVLRQEPSYTKIPIIFLSTEDSKEKKLFAISLGGDDFLTKPISPQHLISVVRSRAKRARVLNYYMTTDSLTGLLNHSSILKQLAIQVEQAQNSGLALSFVMIDIDHFKNINDSYGHPIGDVVIKKLATLLLSRLRSQDSVGRYGGEEFALILPTAGIDEATKIVNNLRKQVEQLAFKTESSDFFVTISAGIACLNKGDNSQAMVNQADVALYEAKKRGRNQVVVYT